MAMGAVESGRLVDIDQAKGLAILLVVFGHVVARDLPADNAWYALAKQSVYAFHMAFFMFLSGVVFFLRARPASNPDEFFSAVRKRFMRLMPAYFLFALIVFAGKWSAQFVVHVDNPVTGVGDLIDIALFPMQSVSAFLWYIYILFLYCAVALALLSLSHGRLWPLLALALALQLVPYLQFLGLGQFSKFFLFFVLGGVAIVYWQSYVCWVDRWWPVALAGLTGVLAAGWHVGEGWRLAALLSIPALHGLCRTRLPGGSFLEFLGKFSFAIYLMNTLAIGATKAIMLKFLSWDGLNFLLVFFPTLMAAGVLIPVVLKRYVFPRIVWLDRITT